MLKIGDNFDSGFSEWGKSVKVILEYSGEFQKIQEIQEILGIEEGSYG